MASLSPRELYEKYSPSVVCIAGASRTGDERTGTAFHIGDGWLVTARHVMDDMRDHTMNAHHYASVSTLDEVLLHEDPDVDVALLRSDFSLAGYMEMTTIPGQPPHLKADHIPVPGMLSDWVGDEMVMTSTVLMGFPPIPLSRRAELVAARGDVMAVIDPLGGRHPAFITSSTPRGGFSGGPVLSEFDFLLGVQSQSLVRDHATEELGFGSAVSVEPIWDLLFRHRVFPADNVETAYLLWHAYDCDESEFGLSEDDRGRLDREVDEAVRGDRDGPS